MFPVLFSIGPYKVYTFGFLLCLSFVISTFVVWRYAKEELKEEEYLDTFLYTGIVSLICARLVYIIFNFDQFGLNLLRYIVVRETPGLSLLGGLTGGVFFLWYYSKIKKLQFFQLLDLFSLATVIFLIFAKIGQELSGAGFGKQTTSILAVRIIGLTGKRHPAELYEAVFYFLLSLVLFFVYKKILRERWPTGLVFYLFSALSLFIVFLVEFLKDYGVYLYGLSLRQVAALIMIILIAKPLLFRILQLKQINKKN